MADPNPPPQEAPAELPDPDDEVMPPDIARLIDSLHRNFYEQFRNVE